MKIGLVVKSLGNGFFDAANKGAQEAAKELGGVEVIYTGPTSHDGRRPDRSHQFADRTGRRCDRDFGERPGRRRSGAEEGRPARHQGYFLGFRRWSKEGRILQLNPSSNELIGKMCLTLAQNHLRRRQGRFRDPFGNHHLDEPEHLDRPR